MRITFFENNLLTTLRKISVFIKALESLLKSNIF